MSYLIKQKDPILLELKAICESRLAIPVTLVHANLFEANFGLDQLTGIEFPVLVHVATTRSVVEINEAHDHMRTAKIVLLLLDKVDLDTADYKSYDLNDSLNRMRNLGENLIYQINRSALSVNGGVDKYESDNVYQQFDAHLFGQAMSFDWMIDTATAGWLHQSTNE